MNHRRLQSVCRLVVLLAAALTAILTLVAGPADSANAVSGTASGTITAAVHTASGPTGLAAETRVGASTVQAASLVGAAGDITAGQRRDDPSPQPEAASATSVAAEGGIDATQLTMTKTVEQHLGDIAKDGTLSRPYGDSRLTIQSIMDSAKPVPDPGGVPGALRWDVPGSMNRSSGTWQLVVDPNTNTILHFLFVSGR